jgi:DNA-directed RNA polymerase specialized sigma24 family protein
LIVAALGGDEGARATLVLHLTPVIRARVTRCLMRYGRRNRRPIAQEVADFTQDVFMFLFAAEARALRAWDTRRGCSLKNFVGLVAQRHVVSVLRGPKSPWRDAAHDPLVDVRAQCELATPEHVTASREELRWLVERLGARLSAQGLEMFYRLCVTQESVEAICGATGLKVASVYQWRRRVTSAVQATLASHALNR